MKSIRLFIDLPKEVKQTLSENGITIGDLLSRNGISVNIDYAAIPLNEKDGRRSKDLVPVIISSSVGISVLILSIAHLIDVIFRRPRIIEISELECSGNFDQQKTINFSDAQWKLVKRQEFVEPIPNKTEFNFDLSTNTNGIVLKYKSSPKN